MTRRSRIHNLSLLLAASAILGACERDTTRPPDERIDAPEADQDSDGGDGVQDVQDNPGARIEENAGAPEDE
jgi:hypothetical protein